MNVLVVLGVACFTICLMAEATAVEELVITGTKSQRAVQDLPVRVDVVSGSAVELRSQTTLAQALDLLPGVVTTRSVKGGYNVQMQGFDGDRVLVLINGRRLISPTGSSADLDQISALNIERIEIVRGPSSVLYGSAAMGGVINIITRKNSGNSLLLQASLGAFSDNQIGSSPWFTQAAADANFQLQQWQGGLRYQRIDNNAIDYIRKTDLEDVAGYEKSFGNAYLRKKYDTVEAEYRFQSLQETRQRNAFVIPGQGSGMYVTDSEQIQHDIIIKSRRESSWKVLSTFAAHSELSGRSSNLREADFKLAQVDIQSMWETPLTDIVGGVELNYNGLDQFKVSDGERELPNKSRGSVETYVQSSWMLGSKEVLLGARYQYDTDFGGHTAFSLNFLQPFALRAGGTGRWRVGVGDGYKVPTLKQRFYRFDHSNLGYAVLGSSDLLPESSAAITGSLDLKFPVGGVKSGSLVKIKASLHYSDAENLIDTAPVENSASHVPDFGEGVDISSYQNIGLARMKGADVGVAFDTVYWNFNVDYNYLDAHNEINDERLPERPRHLVKAQLQRQFKRFNSKLLFSLHYKADEFMPNNYVGIHKNSWMGLNLSIKQTFAGNMSLQVGIDNLLNTYQVPEVEEFLDIRPAESRKIYVSMSYRL